MTQKNSNTATDSNNVMQLLSKALAKESQWNDKDELLDVLYWGRQILSLLLGLLWGYFPLKGVLAIVLYVVFSTLGGHFYIINYQKVNFYNLIFFILKQEDEQFGGFMEIAKEGFGSAFATFMVSWITCYSAVHFGDE